MERRDNRTRVESICTIQANEERREAHEGVADGLAGRSLEKRTEYWDCICTPRLRLEYLVSRRHSGRAGLPESRRFHVLLLCQDEFAMARSMAIAGIGVRTRTHADQSRDSTPTGVQYHPPRHLHPSNPRNRAETYHTLPYYWLAGHNLISCRWPVPIIFISKFMYIYPVA
jgi:hypothetical protein